MKEVQTIRSLQTAEGGRPSRKLDISDIVHTYFFYCAKGMIGELERLLNEKNKASNEYELLKKCVKGPHQRRMKSEVCLTAAKILEDSKILHLRFADFEELYCMVKNLLNGVNGIGDLTVYDVSKRIGHIIEHPVYPEQYVYSSRGAAIGASGLLGRKIAFREPTSVYAPYFNVPSIFIEDILCIFKDYFALGGINSQKTLHSLIKKLSPCCSSGSGLSCYNVLKKQKFILDTDED